MPTLKELAPTRSPIQHPGYAWVDEAACGAREEGDAPFFVEAGRVIDSEVLRTCQSCPVRRECIIHSYIGGPEATPIGAGYFGGFSLGQRKAMTLRQALERAARESTQGQQGSLL